jgi:3-oxoadipate enol-lactonase
MPSANVNGTTLHYRSSSSSSSPDGDDVALLLLHGFTLDHRMWNAQFDALASKGGLRVIAYDSRGFGKSAMPSIDVPYKHCEDAAALADHLGLKRVIAVGHSIAANHLLELAAIRPALVTGFISVCGSGLSTIPFPPNIQATFAAVRAAISEGRGVEAAKRLWSQCDWFASSRAIPEVAEQLDTMLADYTGWQWTHANPVQNIDSPPLVDRLKQLKMPALVITGDKDIPYNDQVGDALCQQLPNAKRIRIPAAGHMANMESPLEVNESILKFVQSVKEIS